VTFERPSNLRTIPDELFLHCQALKSLSLPESLLTIAGSAFISTGITFLIAPGHAMCGPLFVRLDRIVRCLGRPQTLRIPSTFREIGEKAFQAVSSLVELSFEEGVQHIGFSAFCSCSELRTVALPASLVVIDESAFSSCRFLREVTFAPGSKLQKIGKEAFSDGSIEKVSLPASLTEIEPSAFSDDAWKIVKFEGAPLLVVDGDFLCSQDSRTMLRSFSWHDTIVIPAHFEAIGKGAFRDWFHTAVVCENRSGLNRIGEEAFSHSEQLRAVTVPASVEILGNRCFDHCPNLVRVAFEAKSKLRKIGEQAFAFSGVQRFKITASVNEIDGSAFVGCQLEAVSIDQGNRSFILRETTLLTSDGTEIVRSFGIRRKIVVPREVEILQKSCFELLHTLTEVKFESGSKLRKIGRSAVAGCDSLSSIVLPPSVTEIEGSAFKDCIGLEDCLIDEDTILEKIGQEAFAGCICLISFYVPKSVKVIGESCFRKCRSLYQLGFGSGETLKSIVGDTTLDEALEHLGVTEISNQFRIEVVEDGANLAFPGWIPLADESSPLALARCF
jgi:hypothetical protein